MFERWIWCHRQRWITFGCDDLQVVDGEVGLKEVDNCSAPESTLSIQNLPKIIIQYLSTYNGYRHLYDQARNLLHNVSSEK